MKIFLTGATGFIGRHLCQRLTAQGHTVVCLVRNPDKARLLPKENIQIIRGDLASFRSPDFRIPQCDRVIHLAATITAKTPAAYTRDNFEAVQTLYECLLRQNWRPKRLLFASSLAAAGPANGKPLTEDDPARPIDPYGAAKLKAENFLVNQSEFPVTVFRPCIVIGPMDANVFNLYRIARTGFGFIRRGPRQPISFISVADLVDAIDKLAQDTTQNHRTYFIAHDQPTDTAGLWLEVARTLGKNIRIIRLPDFILYTVMQLSTLASRLFNTQNIFDKKYYIQMRAPAWTCSSKRLQNDFGWKPRQSLAQVVQETTQAYRQAGWLR